MKLKKMRFASPNPTVPYYHVVLALLDLPAEDLTIRQVRVNSERNRDYTVVNDGVNTEPGLYITSPSVLKGDAQEHEIILRVDWSKGDVFDIELDLNDVSGAALSLKGKFVADESYGYWNKEWKYYASHVLKETAGYDRVQEPVHIVLSMYADRVTDPEKEIRVIGIDPESGSAQEVRSQVYSISTWDKWANENCQPSTTIQLAFMADVFGNSEKVYLFFYGNPNAEIPIYETDLQVSGDGYALTINNSCYTVNLHKDSGSIDEIIPRNRPELVYCHHLETNGALQWNPGVYAPPKTWMHASDWVHPSNFQVIKGPVFVMVKRFDAMPDYEEVDVSLTYIFYSHSPAITVESNIDVKKDLDVTALRNGSVVLNRETTGDFAWRDVDHKVKTVHITDLPRHPIKAMVFDAKTPWFAFYNRKEGNGLGVMNLEFYGIRRAGGLLEWEPYYYLHWGPWYYISRPIIYAFTSNNPQRVMHMTGGSSFYERFQLIPFEVAEGEKENEGFDALNYAYNLASQPLSKTAAKFDTDERVPDEWVGPILVSHFEEMVD